MAQRLGNVPVGTTLHLNEHSVPQDYIVVHQGLPSSIYDASCTGTWLRKVNTTGYTTTCGLSAFQADGYNATNIASYLASTAINLFDPDIQAVIKTVKIPYCSGSKEYSAYISSGANGFPCKLFAFSAVELGYSSSRSIDGVVLAYFASGSTTLRASDGAYFTRTLYGNSDPDGAYWGRIYSVSTTGAISEKTMSSSSGILFGMVLPPDLIVDDDGNILAQTTPEAPASITVPTDAIPSGGSIPISWTAQEGVTYTLQRSANGGSWQTIYTGDTASYTDTAGAWTQVKYQVAASLSGLSSGYTESAVVTILPYTISTFTVPQQVMTGQDVPLSWSAVSAATSYQLERSANGGEFTQIYSGSSTSYTDPWQEGWTSLQYRVRAGTDGTYGSYNTSASIPIIAASALVISGTDSDLGMLTSDVPYTVSAESGNDISVERRVNGQLVATVTVESGFAYAIPVMDLPTGSGTIQITATVNTGSGNVSTVRNWTYTKTPITFPDAVGVGPFSQEGKAVFPATLAEAVRVPAVWGGALDKALELLLPLVNSAVISVGAYTGTGTYGADAPNSLVFDTPPAVVTIYGAGATLVISGTDTSAPAYISGNTATWYSTESAAAQMNTDGTVYSYVAVGRPSPNPFSATITVTCPSGSTVTCANDGESLTQLAVEGTAVFVVDSAGTWTVTAQLDGQTASDTVEISASGQSETLTLIYQHIYGVEWDGTSTTLWSRTDDSVDFVDPVPYMAGDGSYQSPFDSLYPWSGMVRSTDEVAGELVAIPKFWFRWTQSGNSLKLQIADRETPGFFVSPAHADRGDGAGERDVVYIGRYHCGGDWTSRTGVVPQIGMTRSAARSGIHALGSDIWQCDLQMRMTLWMLYLVEFADWNSEKTIGMGCGNNSAPENMGYTDSMPYHTGTTLSSRDTYGLGTQYRNIEGLWDNVMDWCDGCYYNTSGLNVIMNPSYFSDSAGGTAVGLPAGGGVPSAFAVAGISGMEWCIYPTSAGGSATTYACDYWNYAAASPCLRAGGSCFQNDLYGMFLINCYPAATTDQALGARLQKLP